MKFKTLILVIVSIVVILVLFAFEKMRVPDDITEPIHIVETFSKGVEYSFMGEHSTYATFKKGKVLYRVRSSDINFETPDEQFEYSVYVFYDIYNTDTTTDIHLFTLKGLGTVKRESNTTFYLDEVEIPLESERLINNISTGYEQISSAFRNEFNSGFPDEPTEDSLLGYVRWFFNSVSHTVKSGIIGLDFLLYPLNIYGGLLF